MNAKDRSKAWAIDQLDPDNWLEIPDFGILPQDVVFEGFAYPLVSPTVRGRGLREIIREQIRTARALIRRESLTLAEVKANYLQVLDMMIDGGEGEKIDATHAQAMSTFYMVSMGSADQASRYSYGGFENVITPRTLDKCYSAIAQCAQGIRSLAVQCTIAKSEAISVREIRSTIGKLGALAKLATDPKQKDKALVRECWDAWRQDPGRYKSKAAFARDMREKFPNLESQPVIEGWCRSWERES